MRLLIDYSVMCHVCWHVMKSQNYEAKTDIEAEEFARNLVSAMVNYTTRFKPTEIILAIDAKGGYWRHKVMEKYYQTHCVVSSYIPPLEPTTYEAGVRGNEVGPTITYILTYDLKQYRISYVDGPDKWVSKKLNKAEKAEVSNIEQKIIPYNKVPDGIKEFFPSYKGSRKTASWDYATPREEWHRLCAKIAKNLAVTFSAKIIDVPLAEADDIAKVYADVNSSQDMIFLTTDSDWSQMLSDHLFLKIYSPLRREWMESSPDKADWDLAVKLMSGDSSDSIPAISLKGAVATIGPKAAEKLLMEHKLEGIYDYLEVHADHDSLYRNYELIYLDNMDEMVENLIVKSLKSAKIATSSKPYKCIHYGLSKKDEIAIRLEAEEARNRDIEDGLIAE